MANKISLEVVNFKKELARIEQEVKDIANLDILAKMTYATEQLRIVTPVDTGTARAGWEQLTIPEQDGTVGGIIKNDVEYISVLNDGHSKQAPKYFIEQVLVQIGILTPN